MNGPHVNRGFCLQALSFAVQLAETFYGSAQVTPFCNPSDGLMAAVI